MLMKTAAAAVLVLALTGCGGDGSSDGGDDQGRGGSTPNAGSAAPGLAETCEKVASATSGLDVSSPGEQLESASAAVSLLLGSGDVEAQGDLVAVVNGLVQLQQVAAMSGTDEERQEAFGVWSAAMDKLSDRCTAAGSSALD